MKKVAIIGSGFIGSAGIHALLRYHNILEPLPFIIHEPVIINRLPPLFKLNLTTSKAFDDLSFKLKLTTQEVYDFKKLANTLRRSRIPRKEKKRRLKLRSQIKPFLT